MTSSQLTRKKQTDMLLGCITLLEKAVHLVNKQVRKWIHQPALRQMNKELKEIVMLKALLCYLEKQSM